MIRLSIIFFIALGLFCRDASATRPFVDYKCLAKSSDYIFIAKVLHVAAEPAIRDFRGGLYPAKFLISKSVKGVPTVRAEPTAKFEIMWRSEDVEMPRLVAGDEYILFVKNHEAGPFVLNGLQGAMKINGGNVTYRSQKVRIDTFMKEVVSASNVGGADRRSH